MIISAEEIQNKIDALNTIGIRLRQIESQVACEVSLMEITLRKHVRNDSAPHDNEDFVSDFNYFFANLREDVYNLGQSSLEYNKFGWTQKENQAGPLVAVVESVAEPEADAEPVKQKKVKEG